MGASQNYNRLGVGHYMRLCKKGSKCTFDKPCEQGAQESIRKLLRLKEWCNYFHLENTYLPQIINFLELGGWKDSPVLVGGCFEELTPKQDLIDVKRWAANLIYAGIFTRKPIQECLQKEFPYIHKYYGISQLMNLAKNPKYGINGRVAHVDEETGIWSFS
jgi:hypothetical protein